MSTTATRVQTNIVRRDGVRAVLMTILKAEGASTLEVVRAIREALPRIQAQLPPALTMEPLFDQSVFVRAAITDVLKEGAIAAGLTALMILLFLGSWREYADRRHFDPALDPGLHHRALGVRSIAEHDDPGRPRPGGRHPGG